MYNERMLSVREFYVRQEGELNMERNDIKRYEDIIDLPHHVSSTRPHMAIADRAAQFAPFAALTGYGDAVNETARLTDERAVLDEDRKIEIDAALRAVKKNIGEHPELSVTYFKPDDRKTGGSYITVRGAVKKADTDRRALVFEDGTEVPFDDIYGIKSCE